MLYLRSGVNIYLERILMTIHNRGKRILVVCTTDSMIWNFLVPHILMLINNGYDVECVCSRTGFYFDELVNKYNIILHELPFDRQPLKLCNLRACLKLIKLIRSRKIDTIFCHEPVGGAIGRIAGFFTSSKIIYMAHGFHFYKGVSKRNWVLYYPVEKVLSYITDVLITINQEDYERAKNFGCKKLEYIKGIGVDTHSFFCKELSFTERNAKRKELGIPENCFLLLSVGELIKRKNHETVIYMMSILKDDNIHYAICGSGRLETELRNLAIRLNIHDRIHFLGFRKDVNEIYHLADIFIFPSYQEGLSIALIEAMASGLPVICSKIRGNIDLIVNEKGGYLIDVEDFYGYKRAVEKILNNNNKNKFGEFNKQYVKQFDIDIIEREILRIFEELH